MTRGKDDSRDYVTCDLTAADLDERACAAVPPPAGAGADGRIGGALVPPKTRGELDAAGTGCGPGGDAAGGAAGDDAVGDEVIRARGVDFCYGERRILRGVDLSVRAGQIVGLLGPNGTGKSTLVGVLTGDLRPSAGTVTVAGRDIASYARVDLARVRSVMPQSSQFPFAYLTRDIVAMGRAAWARTPAAADDADVIEQAMAAADVDVLQDRDVTQLSGGEKARVTLARVLAQQARIVFLDEPTAALDIYHQEKTMRICRQLASYGVAVVAVMHDIQLAGAYCDRIALMSRGAIVNYGPPARVLRAEALTRVYDYPIDVFTLAAGQIIIVPRRGA